MKLTLKEALQAQTVETSSGTGARTAATRSTLALEMFVNVSAVSGGTPSADFILEVTPDGTNWYEAARISGVTATGKYATQIVRGINILGIAARVRWEISGSSPSFTFAVDAIGTE